MGCNLADGSNSYWNNTQHKNEFCNGFYGNYKNFCDGFYSIFVFFSRVKSYFSAQRVNQCTCTFRACSFTAWFSRLKRIKSDRKIQHIF